MDQLLQEFAIFLGASVIILPITGLLTWALFRALKSRMSRTLAVLTSCIAVSIVLTLLGAMGRESFIDRGVIYQQLAIGIWLIVGLLFWGKKKAPLNPPV